MTPSQAKLLRLLQRNPGGLGLTDIITITGGTHHTASYGLRDLRDAGLAGSDDTGGAGVLWVAVEDLDALKAKRAAARATLAAATKERAKRREVSTMEREAEEAACEAFAKPPVHRILPQSDWTGRMPTRGIASVFQQGGASA